MGCFRGHHSGLGLLRGAKELATLATRQAELESTNERVEAEVARQTARLESVSQELIGTARRAGMAEIATGVLHNVGNVLNSVNISASVAMNKLKESEISSLFKVSEMLQTNQANLPAFLTTDDAEAFAGVSDRVVGMPEPGTYRIDR